MIYLDHNATAPLRRESQDAMAAHFAVFGNASSAYQSGREARSALESARRQIAQIVGCEPREVFWTSGGTESNNMALFGCIDPGRGDEVLLAATEHSSVVESARELERRGARVQWLRVDQRGRVDPSEVSAGINNSTRLVSVGWANNEVGTIQDIAAIAAICRERAVVLHCDAVQGLGKVGTELPDADLLSITAHKVGGPKGIGALIRRRNVEVRPLLFGGSQERGLRPGTENPVSATGFAAALVAAQASGTWTADLREQLWRGIETIEGARRYSASDDCLPNTLLAGFDGLRGESVVAALDLEGIAVSVGSACSAGSGEPSHVLQALGYSDDEARGGVRFSTGPTTTAEEIAEVVAAAERVVQRIRAVGATPMKAAAS